MVKTYISKESFSLSTSIFVGSKEFIVEFENGIRYPITRNGTFSTDCAQLQKALESSSGYGVKYELLKSHSALKLNPKKESVELRSIESVKSKQMAIEWIRIHLKKEFTAASDSALIGEFALSNHIVFPNWKAL